MSNRMTLVMTMLLIMLIGGIAYAASMRSRTEPVPAVGLPQPISHDKRTAFVIDRDRLLDVMGVLGEPWTTEISSSVNDDSFSAGQAYRADYRGGSSSIYTVESGRVWNVQLRTGAAGHCGSSEPIAQAMPILLAAVSPDEALTKRDVAILRAGLLSGTAQRIDLRAAQLITLGGCVPSLTIKAV